MIDLVEERLAAVARVRSYIDTPWVHQGRLQGRGIDCIGLALVAVPPEELHEHGPLPANYGRLPHANMLRKTIEAHTVQVSPEQALAGDIVLAAQRSYPTHLLVLVGRQSGSITPPFNIVHASAAPTVMRVRETTFDWKQWNVTGVYRFKRWA